MRNILIFSILCWGGSVFAQIAEVKVLDRLDSVDSNLSSDYGPNSRSFIDAYIRNEKNQTLRTLEEFVLYDSALSIIFEANKIPKHLRYACISLSECKNGNHSEGREGYFKMRYSVAKRNGLNITNYVDERLDVLKSADAFCKEIKYLYTVHKDWRKALTIYSGGDLAWQKAKSVSNDSTNDFWTIQKALPKEIGEEYSHFMGALYIANYYNSHDIPVQYKSIITDTVHVIKEITLRRLSKALEMDYNDLTYLNPTYKRGLIPNSTKTYFVSLPLNKVVRFREMGDTIYTFGIPIPDSTIKVVNGDTIKVPVEEVEAIPAEKPKVVPPSVVYYKVRSGDVLGKIADYYDCGVSQIKRWNGLRSDRIRVNQRLKIVVPPSRKSYYLKINKMSKDQLRRVANKD